MKPATVEIRKAIDTLVDFSMFTETDKIRTIAVKSFWKRVMWVNETNINFELVLKKKCTYKL